ncbi:MAG: hypothetical protein JNM47_16170 [Hyphomonadaceae bacterium]|nr:hypothetical protein [Hyphomonadaceae bacterium]
MFWIAVIISVLIIFLLTWFGASMTRRGLPNGWENRNRRRRGGHGGPIYGPNDHDPFG